MIDAIMRPFYGGEYILTKFLEEVLGRKQQAKEEYVIAKTSNDSIHAGCLVSGR
jgi:hypothetical protein